jgi:Tol biopolymer transport system component
VRNPLRFAAVAPTDPDFVCTGAVAAKCDMRSIGRVNSTGVEECGCNERLPIAMGVNSDNVVPSWSHDGNAIYFSSDRTGDWQIWRHSLDTGAEVQVTINGGFNAMEASDGKSLVYVGDLGRTEIRRLSLQRIQDDVSLASLGPGMWHAGTVSHGGLLYLKRLSSPVSTTLFRLDLSSRKLQGLGQAAQAVNDSISASPDGRGVLFARRSNTTSSIMILDGWN